MLCMYVWQRKTSERHLTTSTAPLKNFITFVPTGQPDLIDCEGGLDDIDEPETDELEEEGLTIHISGTKSAVLDDSDGSISPCALS